jgi:hypothetical protein
MQTRLVDAGIPNRRALMRRFNIGIRTMRADQLLRLNTRRDCMAFIDVENYNNISDKPK